MFGPAEYLSMRQLTPDGQRVVSDMSQRHGFSEDAVTHMLFALLNGNGSMAQFNHFEFGGSGQWMLGGMMMLGDMFNHALKGRVDALCYDLSGVLANQPGLLRSGSFQSQSQGGASHQNQASGAPAGNSSLFVPDPEDNWWPQDIGPPSATGSQNNVRYAYFANARRLAVKTAGDVWLYDTLDHQIGGFSQQQGGGSSILFTSQFGTVALSSLPVVAINGRPPQQPAAPSTPATQPAPSNQPAPNAAAAGPGDVDPIAAITRLGELHSAGVLTDAEFAEKKAELLKRI